MARESFYESEKFLRAEEKFEKLGPWGVTAGDHIAVGSTPPELLEANPGKTKVELMTDDEILIQLRKWREEIEENSGEKCEKGRPLQSFLSTSKEGFNITLEYLRALGRLPDEFKRFKSEVS